MIIAKLMLLFIMLQATTGGVYIDSGTYTEFNHELFPVGQEMPFAITIQHGGPSDDYALYRATFVWFNFKIFALYDMFGTEVENATVNAQLIPFEVKELSKGDTYSFYPNSTVYYSKGQSVLRFSVKFLLTNTTYDIAFCNVTLTWTLEWEYRQIIQQFPFMLVLLIGGIVAVPVVVTGSCFILRRRAKTRAEETDKILSDKKKEKKKKKEQNKVNRSGKNK